MWFTLDDLYGRKYAAAGGGGGVGDSRSDADADSDADEEGEAREGRKLGEDKELIGRDRDDTVDAVGGRCGGGA